MHSSAMNTVARRHLDTSDGEPRFGSTRLAAAITFVVLTLAVLALLLLFALPARGQTETVLYSFTGGSDGGDPTSNLAFDAAGNLYGTTYSGGLWGDGTVFELSPNGDGGWNETVLYSFTGGSDGANPTYSYVMFDGAGNLYGTAYNSGANGYGVVFELSPVGGSWTETVLYSFTGSADGANPVNGLIMDGAGNLYGKTYSGGKNSSGTVFELSPFGGDWTIQVITPIDPYEENCAGLSMDSAGNIYTTESESVFEMSPDGEGGWRVTGLHTFRGGAKDGLDAESTPVLDPWGDIYGTTVYGGAENHGTIYMLVYLKGKKKSEQRTFIVRHSFLGGKKDGFYPWGGVVYFGNEYYEYLYGTALGGEDGDGVVFGLNWIGLDHWKYMKPLPWSFNGADGRTPFSGLIPDGAGNLYGTTSAGGSNGAGVVFELTP